MQGAEATDIMRLLQQAASVEDRHTHKSSNAGRCTLLKLFASRLHSEYKRWLLYYAHALNYNKCGGGGIIIQNSIGHTHTHTHTHTLFNNSLE